MEKLYCISLDSVQPGSKLKLKGRLEVKRGVYLLRNCNVEVVQALHDPGFKSVGNVSFNQVMQSIINPVGIEKKMGLLQKRKQPEVDGSRKIDNQKMFEESVAEARRSRRHMRSDDAEGSKMENDRGDKLITVRSSEDNQLDP